MIVLSPVEILALGAAKNHAPGIRTRDGVLDEESWRAGGLGPPPSPEFIAAARASYEAALLSPRDLPAEIDALRARSAKLEAALTAKALVTRAEIDAAPAASGK